MDEPDLLSEGELEHLAAVAASARRKAAELRAMGTDGERGAVERLTGLPDAHFNADQYEHGAETLEALLRTLRR